MKAWRYNDSPESRVLARTDIEPPEPGSDELLVRVHAAG